MANIIMAKIYKSRIPACKYAKKVNGHVVKEYHNVKTTHGQYTNVDKYGKCYYVVHWGNYKKA